MVDYMDEFERLSTQLSTLNPNEWPKGRKMKLQRKDISPAGPDIRHMLRKIKKLAAEWDFTKCVTYLRDEAFDYNKEHPLPPKSTSSHLAHAEEDQEVEQNDVTGGTSDDAYARVDHMITNLGLVIAYKVLSSQTMHESLYIPGDIWFKLEPTKRQKIDKIKQEIRAERETKAKFHQAPAEPSKPSSPQSLPHQYPNKIANKAEIVTEDMVKKHITIVLLVRTIKEPFILPSIVGLCS